MLSRGPVLLGALAPFLAGAPSPSGATATAWNAPASQATAEDVALRLAELASPVAADRARAERWLAAHLAAGDQDAVARAAAEAGAEGRRRLGRAVGAEDRLLGLAAGLAAHPEPAVAGVGRDAVRELALAWSPDLDAAPLVGDELSFALQRSVAERTLRLLRVDLAAPLEDVLDLLRRSGEVPLNLVVDPPVADRARARVVAEELPYVAAWSQLLPVLAGVHGLALEGCGIDADGRTPGGAFVVFRAPRSVATRGGVATRDSVATRDGAESGTTRVQGWVRAIALPPGDGASPAEEAVRRGRMEALLATGWPAAWMWIDARHAAGDTTAGEALLVGAAAGVWPAGWRAAEHVLALLERLRLLQASGFEPEAGRVARALAAAPARLAAPSPDGIAVAELFGAAWDGAGDPERRQLLVALEGVGAPGDPAQVGAWERRLRELFARPAGAASPELLRQALRAWCAVLVPADVAPPSLPWTVLGADVAWSLPERLELAALLGRSGAAPPSASALASASNVSLGARVTLVGWLAAAGEHERAAELAVAIAGAPVGGDTMLGELFGRMVRRGDAATARAVLDAGGADARIERVALLAGLLAPDRRAEVSAAIAAAEPPELALLGVAAGVAGEAGEGARERLLRALAESLQGNPEPQAIQPVLTAVERAMADLLRAEEDGAAADLRRAAAVRVYGAPAGAMRDRLAAGGWPVFPPELDALELGLLRRP